ncbi:MAG: hypothetical protein FDX12_09540 [Chlorobium sp.]|jgi:tetratricopeptide (TPR) repeat protein|nr:MAG: hypothetical protein FDX12_09540 [Chlorobium sp.]
MGVTTYVCLANYDERCVMNKYIRFLVAGNAVILVLAVTGCDNSDGLKNVLPVIGEKIGNAVVQGSMTELSKVMKLSDQSANAYTSRAALKYTMGDREGAIADFTKAIEIDPKSVAAYSGRGSAKITNGDITGASTDYIEVGKLIVLSKLKGE